MPTESYPLFCMGNPLLDIQVYGGEDLLKKYNLKENDAILAGEEHATIYDDVVKYYTPVYVAGGAAQNAARAAAYILPQHSVVYVGCVGDDDLAIQLKKANQNEGVESAYLVKKGEKTGACAVVLTSVHRSLVTTLRAAQLFDPSHLATPEVATYIHNASHFYLGGFFLTHGLESALLLATKAAEDRKVFAMNLSAPKYIVIGNESEAEAWAEAHKSKDLGVIAKAIAAFEKVNTSHPRIVVITNGAKPTITYPIYEIKPEDIVDTNGAGDAFAGGFIGALVLGKSIDEAVDAGHRLGSMCVGPQLKWPKENIF
ncbi:hypothetical protein BS47DRAFT_1373751 [Hydnum rufescens UP504]|uniref:Adenosine kinase n=1 Tax=Hydnum rufescens UP504 TaxID=1448309 RepID=A0A9P6DR24_9AGAM|nr:hypothetical protein BS47DRAFT_1373751 [Hydnum rufescens UP504]